MSQQLQEISDTFTDADLSLIKEIIYFDGWCTYEESGGYLIFRSIDDSIQKVDYGYSVMSEDNRNLFYLEEVTECEANNLISQMNEVINGEFN